MNDTPLPTSADVEAKERNRNRASLAVVIAQERTAELEARLATAKQRVKEYELLE